MQNEADRKDNLENLLVHMRGVRAAIPVNQELRVALRARLRAELTEVDKTEREVELSEASRGSVKEQEMVSEVTFAAASANRVWQNLRLKKTWFWWSTVGVLALCLSGWFWYQNLAPRFLESGSTKVLSRFWSDGFNLDVTPGLNPADWILLRDGGLVLVDEVGKTTTLFKPPDGGEYLAASFSPVEGSLALVWRDSLGAEQLLRVKVPSAPDSPGLNPENLTAGLAELEALYRAPPGEQLSDLAWSPKGKALVFRQGKDQNENNLFLLPLDTKELIALGPGNHPAWSPDGSWLVVERWDRNTERKQLWLLKYDGHGPSHTPQYLIDGEKPVWGKRGYLVYVQSRDTERILTYDFDGLPLFRVQQRIGEVRSLYLGTNGSRAMSKLGEEKFLAEDQLLLATHNQQNQTVLSWLRQLELERVKEPRTLSLAPTNHYLGLAFALDGRSLLVLHQDKGTVQLEQIQLQEKIGKRR